MQTLKTKKLHVSVANSRIFSVSAHHTYDQTEKINNEAWKADTMFTEATIHNNTDK